MPCVAAEHDRSVTEWLVATVIEHRDVGICPGYALNLSEDQKNARNAILRALDTLPGPFVLTGAAGTGKTTLVQEIIRSLPEDKVVRFAAPTGRAAARLRELSGKPCSTIHSLIYVKPKEEGRCPNCDSWSTALAISKLRMRQRGLVDRSCPSCMSTFPIDVALDYRLDFGKDQTRGVRAVADILICDEASMINEKLAFDFQKAFPRSKILYVGDREQLPPVEGKWGPKFAEPTAALETVHRQALGNPIVRAATDIRTGKATKPFRFGNDPTGRLTVERGSVELAAAWLAQRRNAGADAILITYTNAMRRVLNNRVREIRGTKAAAEAAGLPFVASDRLLVRSNNESLEWMNGETIVVDRVDVWGADLVALHAAGKDVLVHPGLIGEERMEWADYARSLVRTWEKAFQSYNPDGEETPQEFAARLGLTDPSILIHVDYGECVTCHSAQGTEYEEVGIVWDRSAWGLWYRDLPTARRWAYTAATRARSRLHVWFV